MGSSRQPWRGPGVSTPKAASVETLQAVQGPASVHTRWDPPAYSPLITTFCKKIAGDVSSPNCRGVMGSLRSPGLPSRSPRSPAWVQGSAAAPWPLPCSGRRDTLWGAKGTGSSPAGRAEWLPGACWGPIAPGQPAALLLWPHRAPFNGLGAAPPLSWWVPLGPPAPRGFGLPVLWRRQQP